MKYPDLTGKLMIHARSNQRLRVWRRLSKYYYLTHHIYELNGTPHFIIGKTRVGHIFQHYYEVIPNPAVVSWHELCNKYPDFDES